MGMGPIFEPSIIKGALDKDELYTYYCVIKFIVDITDKDLIEKTGGIVQGMSGSPIIQNGKLIGAVTHVFVNDATKGFGIYIDWMLEQ